MPWYKPKDMWKKSKKYVTAAVDRYIKPGVEFTYNVVSGEYLRQAPGKVKETVEDITGVTAMEKAAKIQEQTLEEQKRQYEEQKAAALAEEEALARKAEQEKADASASAYRKLEEDRRRRAAMKGRSSTILTSSLGDTGLTVQRRTLLGG